jgi:hypothetical protein
MPSLRRLCCLPEELALKQLTEKPQEPSPVRLGQLDPQGR